MSQASENLQLGIVVERRPIRHPWADFTWRAVEVIVDPPAETEWRPLHPQEDCPRFHATTLSLCLHRKETEGYRFNLSQQRPSVFVVMRGQPSDPRPAPFLVTACPYEAETYDISGEEWVDAVPMPAPLISAVARFIDKHHVDQPFVKRKRKPHDPRKSGAPKPARKGHLMGPRYG